MRFSEKFSQLPIDSLIEEGKKAKDDKIDTILAKGSADNLADFSALLSPAASGRLEELAHLAQRITRQNFGKTIRLFAPIYLSNECINICKYCGFSRNNPIPRITIPIDQVVTETRKLASQGFRSLLIVAGEHPKYVSNGYVEEVIRKTLPIMPSLSLELGPMETEPYIPLVEAGCEGLVVYQETYHEPTYRELHVAGPKKKYHWRMDSAERAYEAGFRRLGIGALLGLADWRYEALSLAAHAQHLYQHCWKAQLSLSIPRMRPAAGGFQPETRFLVSDRELVQYIIAMRIFLPHAAITLSTREHPSLRNNLVPLGITHMSAGASTEPGGYSSFDETEWVQTEDQPGEQFHIADERSPATIAGMIRNQGYEPVWKDFDQSLIHPSFS